MIQKDCTVMKSLTLNPSIHSDSHVIAVNLPSLSPAQPVCLYSKSSTSLLHLLHGFLLRIKQGVLWFPLGELCRGSRSCSPSSTASWDTKRACVLCQGTWWHFWASESLWISALESAFLEAGSQTDPVSGTLSHARPSICGLSIRLLWRGPCSETAWKFRYLLNVFFFFFKKVTSANGHLKEPWIRALYQMSARHLYLWLPSNKDELLRGVEVDLKKHWMLFLLMQLCRTEPEEPV